MVWRPLEHRTLYPTTLLSTIPFKFQTMRGAESADISPSKLEKHLAHHLRHHKFLGLCMGCSRCSSKLEQVLQSESSFLQLSLHRQSYQAEIASLQRRLRAHSSGRRRCPPFRYLLWGLASFCILFRLVSFGAIEIFVGRVSSCKGSEYALQ